MKPANENTGLHDLEAEQLDSIVGPIAPDHKHQMQQLTKKVVSRFLGIVKGDVAWFYWASKFRLFRSLQMPVKCLYAVYIISFLELMCTLADRLYIADPAAGELVRRHIKERISTWR